MASTPALNNDSTCSGTQPSANLAGYEEGGESHEWERAIAVGNHTEVTLDISKDNVQFGVRAVDTNGHHSPAGFPRPKLATVRRR